MRRILAVLVTLAALAAGCGEDEPTRETGERPADDQEEENPVLERLGVLRSGAHGHHYGGSLLRAPGHPSRRISG